MSSSITNAEKFDLTFADGTKGFILMRNLTIREIRQFVFRMNEDDTPELIALCAGQPVDWVDKLSDASYKALSIRCIERNFQRARDLAGSDLSLAVKMNRVLRQAATLMTPGAIGKSLSAEQSPSTSAAASGSESSTSPQSASTSPSTPPSDSAPKTP